MESSRKLYEEAKKFGFAAGGIRNLDTACSLIKAGATKLGTTSGVSVVKESQKDGSLEHLHSASHFS